jgi:prepilin-type N-terminal cleavage/methylation domain-containing protein
MKERKAGFTLIELLIVMGIITLLMSIVIVGGGFLRSKARIEATAMLITKIKVGLNNYTLAFSAYPPSDGDYDGSQNLYNLLGKSLDIEQGYDPSTGDMMKKKFGPAITNGFAQTEVKNQYIIDAWGKALTYKNPGEDHSAAKGKDNSSFVDIESAGPDGVFDADSASDDDINNWKQDKYLSK